MKHSWLKHIVCLFKGHQICLCVDEHAFISWRYEHKNDFCWRCGAAGEDLYSPEIVQYFKTEGLWGE